MITIKSFEFNYFQENTFLLYDDTREAVLIDCGCCRKEEEKELPLWSGSAATCR